MLWLTSFLVSAFVIAQAPPVDLQAIDTLLDAGFAEIPGGQYLEIERKGQEALARSTAAHDEITTAIKQTLAKRGIAGLTCIL